MRYSWLVASALVAACTNGPGGPSVQQTGPDEFAIPYGQSLVLPGTVFEVAFQELLGDSRCPKDVVCVWEGEGRVELGLTMGDGPTMPFELNTRGPLSVTHAGYVVTLLGLDPYPVSTESHPPEDYVVRLRIVPGAREPS